MAAGRGVFLRMRPKFGWRLHESRQPLMKRRKMEFRHGISPQSLMRWETFERIRRLQEEHGLEIGGSVMRFIVDAELEAIERATSECESHRS